MRMFMYGRDKKEAEKKSCGLDKLITIYKITLSFTRGDGG